MQRIITIAALPTAFNAATGDLYTLLKAVAGAVPTDGILADRCMGLKAIAPAANANTVTIFDRANIAGPASVAATLTTLIDRMTQRNNICLRDFFPVGGAASQSLQCIIDFT